MPTPTGEGPDGAVHVVIDNGLGVGEAGPTRPMVDSTGKAVQLKVTVKLRQLRAAGDAARGA